MIPADHEPANHFCQIEKLTLGEGFEQRVIDRRLKGDQFIELGAPFRGYGEQHAPAVRLVHPLLDQASLDEFGDFDRDEGRGEMKMLGQFVDTDPALVLQEGY